MRIAKRKWSTGAVALAIIGVAVVATIVSHVARGADYMWALEGLALLLGWGGWIYLFVWLIRGYIPRVTLRHSVRVGVWIVCALCLTAAGVHVDGHLHNLGAVSWQLLEVLLGVGLASAGAGWYDWHLSSSRHTKAHDFDDWNDGEGGYGDGWTGRGRAFEIDDFGDMDG